MTADPPQLDIKTDFWIKWLVRKGSLEEGIEIGRDQDGLFRKQEQMFKYVILIYITYVTSVF